MKLSEESVVELVLLIWIPFKMRFRAVPMPVPVLNLNGTKKKVLRTQVFSEGWLPNTAFSKLN